MFRNISEMMADTELKDELRGCKDLDGYKSIDGIFEKHGFGCPSDSNYEERTKVLYNIMGVAGGLGTPSLTLEKIYDLAKDLLASRDWEEFV
ncbi:MAG: hypothetical protein FWG36_04765 [Oscillospiraceae bacterium]|nr:hypothetical protein [Oscillospiraceae bacterium]